MAYHVEAARGGERHFQKDGLAAKKGALCHEKPAPLHGFGVFTRKGGAFLGKFAEELARALFSEKGDKRRTEKANAEIGAAVHRLGNDHVGKEAGYLGGLDIGPIRHFPVAAQALQIGSKLNDRRMFRPLNELRLIRYFPRAFT